MIDKLIPYRKVLKYFVPKRLRHSLKTRLGQRVLMGAIAEHRAAESRPWGINIYALSGASGLAEAARSTQRGLKQAGVSYYVRDILKLKGRELLSPYAVNLIHVGLDWMPELLYRIPKEQWRAGYNIGFWMWEQEQLPAEWVRFSHLFDEVWTASQFCASAIGASCSLPVSVFPHIVEPVCDKASGRAAFGLPDDIFLFLTVFDYHSVIERKNPMGAIRAFLRAFGDKQEKVGLVIKARNLDEKSRNVIQNIQQEHPYIWLLEGDYTKEQTNSLIRTADAYVSLHRAEGFGLPLAEAMYLGTPVIATNWSANTEFMDSRTACLVDAELIHLTKDILPYRKGSRWAQPNEEQAAIYMRRLYEDEKYRAGLSERAKVRIREQLSAERIARLLSERLTKLKEDLEHVGYVGSA